MIYFITLEESIQWEKYIQLHMLRGIFQFQFFESIFVTEWIRNSTHRMHVSRLHWGSLETHLILHTWKPANSLRLETVRERNGCTEWRPFARWHHWPSMWLAGWWTDHNLSRTFVIAYCSCDTVKQLRYTKFCFWYERDLSQWQKTELKLYLQDFFIQ